MAGLWDNKQPDTNDMPCLYCGRTVQLSLKRYAELVAKQGRLPVCASCLKLKKRLGPLESLFREVSESGSSS